MPESYIRTEAWIDADTQAKMTVFSTNHDKATELLNGVGWTKKDDGWYNENDEKIAWTTITTADFQFLNAAQVFSQQLTAFGLNTELKVLESAVMSSMYTAEGEREYEFACNWIDNCWGLFCPYGPLQEGYYGGAFASTAGNFPEFESGERKGEDNMVYADQNGVETDIAALLKTMLGMSDEEMIEAASRIAYITNENVFSISFFQNASGYWLNQNDIAGLPLPEDIEPSGRNVLVPEDPAKLSIVNDHWYIWVAQGLVLSNGTYQAK
jgi:ABC-type transport system substrate-binding protein